MKTLKKILKFGVSPFVLGLILVTHIGYGIYHWLIFLKNGGEFIGYKVDDKASIRDIYELLKEVMAEEETNEG